MMDGMKYGPMASMALADSLRMDPDNPVIRVNQGINLLFTPPAWGGSLTGAMKEFEKAKELDAGYADADLWMAVALHQLQKKDESAAHFAAFKKRHPEDRRVAGFEMMVRFLPPVSQ